jgi:predicted NUDIX family NTP pyrophosphohydrolase
MPSAVSAGLLLFRRKGGEVEFFLAHPGGPYWKNKDEGAWTIPKGLVEEGEDPLATARREFQEETGIVAQSPIWELGTIQQKAGKLIHAWAWQGDADPAAVVSNSIRIEFPRNTGRFLEVPEIDRCGWFSAAEARQRVNPAQSPLIDRLLAVLVHSSGQQTE